MKIFSNKKQRSLLLALTATAVVGTTAALGPQLPLRGTGTYCLSPAAVRALAAQDMTLEATGSATAEGNCVTLPGTGTLSPDLTGGEIPLQGGMRFSSAEHQVDLTNLSIHIRIGEGSTSADIAQDGGPATNIDFVHYPVSPSLVSFTPSTVDTQGVPLSLTEPAATALADAFGDSPVPAGDPLFIFDGHAEITNPLAGF